MNCGQATETEQDGLREYDEIDSRARLLEPSEFSCLRHSGDLGITRMTYAPSSSRVRFFY
jgi:hypothetical protein